MIAIGIDPGLSGAVAALCSRRGFLAVQDLPTCSNGAGPDATIRKKVDARALREVLRRWSGRWDFAGEHVIGAVERMAPFTAGPGRSASLTTLLSMGHSAGVCEGVLDGYCHGVLQPLPQQWGRQFRVGRQKADSIAVATRLYPAVAGALTRKLDHDRAQALLIAHWALGSVNGPVAEPQPAEECAFP